MVADLGERCVIHPQQVRSEPGRQEYFGAFGDENKTFHDIHLLYFQHKDL